MCWVCKVRKYNLAIWLREDWKSLKKGRKEISGNRKRDLNVLGGVLLGLRLRHSSRAVVGLQGAVGNDEVGALPRLDLQSVHGINLLNGTAGSLNNEEVDGYPGQDQAASEDVTVSEVNGTGDERSEETEQEVPKPIGGSGKSHSTGTVAGRIHLSDERPNHWTPGRGEAENEETGEDDQDLAGSGSRSWVIVVQGEVTHGGEDHEAAEHPHGAIE